MTTHLNTARLKEAMNTAGLSQSDLAKALEVSREAVSKWMKGTAIPRPDKLLRLGLLVKVRVGELLVRDANATPIVAFRKKGSAKTTEAHISRAQEMGHLLRPLVQHLPFDKFVKPETLKSPALSYRYIEDLVQKIREDVGVSNSESIHFTHLIKGFANTQTVLIPVLWGKKGNHENAMHILLPDSLTTWVYLNLDVEVHDFKFWMAHELGHVLAPDLLGDAAEDFADAFAAALLMPEDLASIAYNDVLRLRDNGRKMNKIKEIAEDLLISPFTVYRQANAYAREQKFQEISLEPAIHGACKNLSKNYYSVSEALFKSSFADAESLVKYATEQLNSPFFAAMRQHLKESGSGSGYLQSVLNIPAVDAIALHKVLV